MSLPTKSHLNQNPTEGEMKQALGQVYDTLTCDYYRLTVTADGDLLVSLKNPAGDTPSVSNPASIMMRSPTLTTGYFAPVDFTAATESELVAGGTLAFSNGQKGRMFIWAVNNGTNKYLGFSRTPYHDESILHTTVTLGTGSDSDHVIYTPTGISSAAVRLLAEMVVTRGTDTWDTAPSNITPIHGPAVRRPLAAIPYGCLPSNAADTDHDITFTSGSYFDGSTLYTLPAYTKQFDTAFAEGTNAGGLGTSVSLPASGVLYIYAISKNSAPATVDYYGDTSSSGANVPSGWTVIGEVFRWSTDSSSNFYPFTTAWRIDSGIDVYGTNSNGEFYASSTGKLEAWQTEGSDRTLTGTSGTLFFAQVTKTFPLRFAATPSVSSNVIDSSGGLYWGAVNGVPGNTSFSCEAIGTTDGGSYRLAYSAIGRWY